MKTIRRFYFYLLSLISIQVIIWAVVNLLRTIFDGQALTSAVDWLAGGIAFVVVGVPIFWLHWRTAQRDSHTDQEEATSRIRALFLYAMPLATGIPITYALLAIFNRLFNRLFGLPVTMASLGGNQTNLDNLIAVFANLIVLVYFWRVLQSDWKNLKEHENLLDFRRLHRYIWLVYGLGLLVFGTQQLLRFILFQPQDFGKAAAAGLSVGIALILVGLPVFLKSWQFIQISLREQLERISSLRLVVLFVLTLLGIGFSLGALGMVLANALRWLFAIGSWTFLSFMDRNANTIAVAITLSLVWAYFRQHLHQSIHQVDDPFRKAHIQRIYNSLLSFAGLIVTFLGLVLLCGATIEHLYNISLGNQAAAFSDSLAFLIIGSPLWIKYWRSIQLEASLQEEVGREARKSITRKIYLYLALFATVVGTMISAGWWIYGILKAMLDTMPVNFWINFFLQLRLVILFAVFLLYHLRVLRDDGKFVRHEDTLAMHTSSILIIQPPPSTFGDRLINQLKTGKFQNQVTVLAPDQISTENIFPDIDILILPTSILLNDAEPVRNFIQKFSGKVIVTPQDIENWYWLTSDNGNEQAQVADTVASLRQILENRPIRPVTRTNPWMLVAYILAGLFLLLIIFILITALVNLFI